jgi:hypothetical protein
MSDEGFRGVPGVPEGWELVAIRRALNGEFILNALCDAEKWSHELSSEYVYPIIRKIEQPAKYRAFANAEEFKPHRDRWWSWKDDRSNTFPPAAFGKSGHHSHSWEASFDRKVFDDDGTPFGVRIDE